MKSIFFVLQHQVVVTREKGRTRERGRGNLDIIKTSWSCTTSSSHHPSGCPCSAAVPLYFSREMGEGGREEEREREMSSPVILHNYMLSLSWKSDENNVGSSSLSLSLPLYTHIQIHTLTHVCTHSHFLNLSTTPSVVSFQKLWFLSVCTVNFTVYLTLIKWHMGIGALLEVDLIQNVSGFLRIQLKVLNISKFLRDNITSAKILHSSKIFFLKKHFLKASIHEILL